MAKLKSKQRGHGLVPAELGVLWYMLGHRNAEGLFQQHFAVMADEMNSSASTVHRHIKTLIRKKEVEVVVKSRPGSDGHPTTPILRPIPSMEWAHSTGGTGTQIGKSQKPYIEMERAIALENKGSKPIPNHEKPLPNGMNNHKNIVDSKCSVSEGLNSSNAVRCKTLVGSGSLPPGLPPARAGFHWEMVGEDVKEVKDAANL